MLSSFLDLVENNPLLKHVYKNTTANAMQVMDTNGYILHINDCFQNHFGYTPEDLEGKHARVLFTEEDQLKLMPEMEIEKTRQHGAALDRNYLVHKDGSCIWVSGESILTRDDKGATFILKILQDIHEQKLLEKFLKDSNEFSDSVIKTISDALIVVDLDGRILRANNKFYNLFGIGLSTIEGLYLNDLKQDLWSSEKFKEQFNQLLDTNAEVEFEAQCKGGDDSMHHFSVKGSFLDGTLVDKKILFVLADVTAKVESQQQRDDLIAFVVHELRNPLANITLCNQLLESAIEENDKEGAMEFVEKSAANTLRINALIRELFDATMAGSGNLQFNKSTFNFEQVLKEAIETVELSHKSHLIIKEGEADVDVFADRSRITQVLTNYLINAIKYSPGATRVNVRAGIESGHVITSVSDFGPGIPHDKIPHVFERYFRADKTKKTEGLGLGLYLSKQIIDAHKGRVWIESKEGQGSTFYFSIPF